jgi:Na+-transporting NADH:ubiquinone oxidoreductase subunit F
MDLFLALFAIGVYRNYFPSVVRHAAGIIPPNERTYIPESEFPKITRNARIILAIYALTIVLSVALKSWIPLFLIILPHFFGTWLMIIHNIPQHAGLAENVLDHRLNCRTVYMNPISRFIYWNMNYHLEHHIFPLVPFHSIQRLHELIRDDLPAALSIDTFGLARDFTDAYPSAKRSGLLHKATASGPQRARC